MNFKSYVSKYPNKLLYNVQFYKNKNCFVGNINFSVINQTTIINNISIANQFKGLGYGSFLLKKCEKYTLQNYNIKKMEALAWQPFLGSSVVNFYIKNGFNKKSNNYKFYDDSTILYHLIPMEKKYNTNNLNGYFNYNI